MLSKYAWHPPHRPPPAEPSISGRIALLGPVGRCLETALEELLAEDDQATRDDGGTGSGGTTRVAGSNGRNGTDESPGGKVDLPTAETTADGGRDSDGAVDDANGNNGRSVRESTSNLDVRLDDAMSQSILESYRKAVVETKFVHERKPSSASRVDPTTDTAAPAAMLMGEIDHFNRIGGQWRIVVKNAVLKRRSLTTVDNGMPGRSCRKRTVLDWDDDDGGADVEGSKRSASSAASDKGVISEKVKNDSSGVHFLGTIQILAYDDT
jgi:hypothetical protein